jgi:hypothetical protein
VYAGVVGAEMGTPDVGKRLLVEDIEVRDSEGKGATRGREKDGYQLTCCTCTKRKEKGKGNKFVKACESAFSGRVRTRSRGVNATSTAKIIGGKTLIKNAVKYVSDTTYERHYGENTVHKLYHKDRSHRRCTGENRAEPRTFHTSGG